MQLTEDDMRKSRGLTVRQGLDVTFLRWSVRPRPVRKR